MLLTILFGCSDDNKNEQSPGGNYGPGGQDNLNDYNNGLSMSETPPPICRSCSAKLSLAG